MTNRQQRRRTMAGRTVPHLGSARTDACCVVRRTTAGVAAPLVGELDEQGRSSLFGVVRAAHGSLLFIASIILRQRRRRQRRRRQRRRRQRRRDRSRVSSCSRRSSALLCTSCVVCHSSQAVDCLYFRRVVLVACCLFHVAKFTTSSLFLVPCFAWPFLLPLCLLSCLPACLHSCFADTRLRPKLLPQPQHHHVRASSRR